MSQLLESTTGNTDVDTIMAMHRYMRPKGSRTEQAFIDFYLKPLGVKDDKWGNYHLIIGDKPNVLWSSHTDTVHTVEGFQQVFVDEKNVLRLNKRAKSNCLGADDGAGVWIMCEMIKAKIPGMYIFHYGEEKGCEGSTEIAKNTPEIFKDIDIAVAFDRKGNEDIITHITNVRICSDVFGASLIQQLPPGYKLCDTGMRTDIKLYEKLISECVNISVGYTNPHMNSEALDLNHLIKLRDKMISIDTSKLTIKRDPSVVENRPISTHYAGGYRHTPYAHTNTPINLHEIVKRNHVAIADMMLRAGTKYEDLMHLIIEEQKMHPKTWTYEESRLVPPAGWVNPHDPAATKPPAATTPPPANQTPVSGSNARVQTSPNPPVKDTAPHHISRPGAADAVSSPSRGGGDPNNVVSLRTGNPAHEPNKRHHLGSE